MCEKERGDDGTVARKENRTERKEEEECKTGGKNRKKRSNRAEESVDQDYSMY